MKRCLSLILCLALLLPFVSCGGTLAEEFTVPEQTDELVIYRSLQPDIHNHFDTAMGLFREMYPDVEVRVEEFDLSFEYSPEMSESYVEAAEDDAAQRAEAYKNRLLTELMAGSGPDIFLFPEGGVFGDLEKTMSVDIFEDLNPYFEQDETFNYDDFVAGVFDAGVRGDRRLFVPLNYDVPIRLTSLEGLEKWGIELPENMNFDQYETALREVYNQIESDDSRWLNGYDDGILTYLYYQASFRYIDYEQGEVVIDFDGLKKFMDTFAPFDRLYKERTQNGIVHPQFDQGFGYASALLDGELFELEFDDSDSMDRLPLEYYRILIEGHTPVFHGIPHMIEGNATAYLWGCAAIGKSSKNKANAYEFLKILLSDDAYAQEDRRDTPIPVRKQSAERLVAAAVETWIRDETPQEIWDDYIQKYLSAIWNVELVHRNIDVLYIVEETMMPYIEGTKPYEECFEELEERLNFYLSE